MSLNEGDTEGFPDHLGYVFQDPAGRAGLLVRSAGLSTEALEAAAAQVQKVQSAKLGGTGGCNDQRPGERFALRPRALHSDT
ncbi:hypothetical protein ACFSQ7_08540 [Paenibacillus rhizoplanae]